MTKKIDGKRYSFPILAGLAISSYYVSFSYYQSSKRVFIIVLSLIIIMSFCCSRFLLFSVFIIFNSSYFQFFLVFNDVLFIAFIFCFFFYKSLFFLSQVTLINALYVPTLYIHENQRLTENGVGVWSGRVTICYLSSPRWVVW